jgi:hypothetical protein
VVETVDGTWNIDIAQVAAEADKAMPQYGADDWAIVMRRTCRSRACRCWRRPPRVP